MGAIRVALGAGMLARPALVPRTLGADRLTAQRLSWLTGMVGIRDLAVGAGTLAGARTGQSAAWLRAGIVCDLGDVVVLSRAVARGDVNRVLGVGVALTAVGGVAIGIAGLAASRRILDR